MNKQSQGVSMKYAIDSTLGNLHITIKGRLTYTDYNNFNYITNAVGEHENQQCIIDISELDFIDSAGMGMLLMARDKAFRHKVQITIKRPQGQVGKMLELGKFDTIFLIEH